MAKTKKNSIPSGFDDILGNIYSNAEEGESITNIDDDVMLSQPPVEPEEPKNEPPVSTTEDGNADDTESNVHDDNSEIPEDVINKTDNNTPPVNAADEETHEDNEVTDADVIEAQQVSLLFDAVGQSLGWNMADIKEEDRPLTVDALTEYLGEVVKQNSVPEYADDRVRQLDEYVKQGGRFEDFYSKQQEALSIDKLDMDDESNQKAVVRELLKYNGYTDE